MGWVEEDCGNAVSTEIAREFVLFLRRWGGQPQLSISLAAQGHEMKSIHELIVWITDNLDRDLSLQPLADRVAVSIRNFERVFRREVGMSPARYVRRLRIEAAQRLIGRGGKGLEQIALNCGFSCADSMRRVLKQALKPTRGAGTRT